MKQFIAFCGLDCEGCQVRLATVNDDDELRRKVAREWSELNKVEITPDMINCTGCRNRGYTSGRGGWMEMSEKLLLKIAPKSAYRKLSIFFGRLSRSWNKNRSAELVSPCTFYDLKRCYPADLFDHLERIPFNGKEYFAVRDRDTFLTTRYGDYMQLPPEEARVWKHRPLLVDLEHNYEELNLED